MPRRRPSRSARIVKKLLQRSYRLGNVNLDAVQCDGGRRLVSAHEAIAAGYASLFYKAHNTPERIGGFEFVAMLPAGTRSVKFFGGDVFFMTGDGLHVLKGNNAQRITLDLAPA